MNFDIHIYWKLILPKFELKKKIINSNFCSCKLLIFWKSSRKFTMKNTLSAGRYINKRVHIIGQNKWLPKACGTSSKFRVLNLWWIASSARLTRCHVGFGGCFFRRGNSESENINQLIRVSYLFSLLLC